MSSADFQPGTGMLYGDDDDPGPDARGIGGVLSDDDVAGDIHRGVPHVTGLGQGRDTQLRAVRSVPGLRRVGQPSVFAATGTPHQCTTLGERGDGDAAGVGSRGDHATPPRTV